jgi:hypothetical protein
VVIFRSRTVVVGNAVLYVDGSAVIEGPYRYSLRRTWRPSRVRMTFVMLNPSVANATRDDQTIRRCMYFAHRAGAGGLDVVNLYALIATDPAELRRHPDPVGPKNPAYWRNEIMRDAGWVVAAWGQHPMATRERVDALQAGITRPLFCLGTTKSGAPRHPSRLGNDAQLEVWRS